MCPAVRRHVVRSVTFACKFRGDAVCLNKFTGRALLTPYWDDLVASFAYFLEAASSLRNVAMVAAEGSLRLLFFGRRLVLVV